MLKDHPEGLVLSVRVQPKASKNAVRGVHGEALKIALTAPPVEGAANKALIAFMAECLEIPKASVAILSGQTSRSKRLLLRIEPGPQSEARRETIRKKLSAQL